MCCWERGQAVFPGVSRSFLTTAFWASSSPTFLPSISFSSRAWSKQLLISCHEVLLGGNQILRRYLGLPYHFFKAPLEATWLLVHHVSDLRHFLVVAFRSWSITLSPELLSSITAPWSDPVSPAHILSVSMAGLCALAFVTVSLPFVFVGYTLVNSANQRLKIFFLIRTYMNGCPCHSLKYCVTAVIQNAHCIHYKSFRVKGGWKQTPKIWPHFI